MTDVYVNFSTGNDTDASGRGGSGDPYKSIAFALQSGHGSGALQVAAGDTIYVQDSTGASGLSVTDFQVGSTHGSYVDGTLANPITIRPVNMHQVIIDLYWENIDVDYIDFHGFIFDRSVVDDNAGRLIKHGRSNTGTTANIPIGGSYKYNIFRNTYGAANLIGMIRLEGVNGLDISYNLFDNMRARIDDQDHHVLYTGRGYVTGLHVHHNEFRDIGGDSFQASEGMDLSDPTYHGDITIEYNTHYISRPYRYRDQYGTSYATAPTYQQIATPTIVFSNGSTTITSDGIGGNDLSGFEAGSCINVTGSSSNNRLYTVASDSTSTTITTIENTVSESTSAATLTSFDATSCGENFIDWKGSNDGASYIRYNKIYNIISATANQDASGDPGIAIGGGAKDKLAAINVYGNEIVNCRRCFNVTATDSGTTGEQNWNFYNNIWRIDSALSSEYRFIDYNTQTTPALKGTINVYNNTIDIRDQAYTDLIVWREDSVDATLSFTARNNLILAKDYESAGDATPVGDHDYNLYYDPVAGDSGTNGLGNYQGGNDVFTDPTVDGEGYPIRGGAAESAGVSPYTTTDFYGRTYLGDDIGATASFYENSGKDVIITAVKAQYPGATDTTWDITTAKLNGNTPKAAIIYSVGCEADGAVAPDAIYSIGFVETQTTGDYTICGRVVDGVDPSATDKGNTTLASRILGRYDAGLDNQTAFVGFIENGLTLNYTADTMMGSHLIIVFFAGDGITSTGLAGFNMNSNGTAEVVAFGQATDCQPDLLFMMGNSRAAPSSNATLTGAFGVASITGTTVDNQCCVVWREEDNNANHPCTTALYDSRICASPGNGSMENTLEITAVGTDGFTVTPTVTLGGSDNDQWYALGIEFTDRDTWAGVIDTPTTAGADSETSIGFMPDFLGLIPTMLTSVNTISTSGAGCMVHGFSAIDRSNQYTATWYTDDNPTVSIAGSLIESGKALRLPLDDSTEFEGTSVDADFDSFTSQGVDLVYNRVNGTATKMIGFAVEGPSKSVKKRNKKGSAMKRPRVGL